MKSEEPLVHILLATFNGGRFLSKLIDSILTQSYENWVISVSDDGSEDDTIQQLELYSRKDDRIRIINKRRRGGVVRNFSFLLENIETEAKYFMFCDQDDIWDPDKISMMLDSIEKLEGSLGLVAPALVFSDMRLVDETGGVMASSFYSANHLNPSNNLDFRFLIWKCTAYGCTFMFNKNLVDFAVPVPEGVAMHDHWLALIAKCCGGLAFEDKVSLDYRQHGGNVVGGANKSWMGRLSAARKTLSAIRKSAKSTKVHWEQLRSRDLTNPDFRGINLHYFVGRWRFISTFVSPFWRERAVNSFLFSLFFLFI